MIFAEVVSSRGRFNPGGFAGCAGLGPARPSASRLAVLVAREGVEDVAEASREELGWRPNADVDPAPQRRAHSRASGAARWKIAAAKLHLERLGDDIARSSIPASLQLAR